MNRFLLGFLSLCFVAVLAVPANGATLIRQEAAWYRVHLGSGVNRPVTAEEITRFVDTVVSDRFPEGFTITDARGQWESEEYGLTKEHTTVLDIQCDDSSENFTKIREIADMYIKQFAKARASCFIKRIPGINTILYYQ